MSLGVCFLDEVLDMPVIVHVVFFVLKTVEVLELQFLDKVVDVFFVQFIDGVDVPVIMQRRVLLSVLGKVVDMPVVFDDRCLGLSVQETVEIPQLHVDVCWRSSSTVVDVPVLMQRRVLQFLDRVVYTLRPTTGAWG